jgi:NADPH-dependent curcumin reductase CurA
MGIDCSYRVGQFAAKQGLAVIGSVGDDAKVDLITKELGFAGGFNYKKEKTSDALKRLAPDGIDIFYDNVGGETLDDAMAALKLKGRISEYLVS